LIQIIIYYFYTFYNFIVINTSWAPHLEMSPNMRFAMAIIALFSASEQSHHALIVSDSE